MQAFLHAQQRNSTCAVAAVRTILHRQFGVRIAEAALVALGRTVDATILDEGTDTVQIRRIVRGASTGYNRGPRWTLRVRKHGTVRQLHYWTSHGRWPMVQVYLHEQEQHHAIVVLRVTKDRVWYFNPDPNEGKQPQSLSHEQFLEWWFSPWTSERWWAVINGGDLVHYE